MSLIQCDSGLNRFLIIEEKMDKYEFGVLTDEDYEEALSFLRRDFLQVEVVTRGIGLSPPVDEDAPGEEDSKQFIRSMFIQGLTIRAKCKETGRIVGLRISTSMEEDYKNISQFENLCAAQDNFKKLAYFYEALFGDRDLHEEYQVTNILLFLMLSVGKDHRRQGLASELIKRSMELAREKGFDLIRAAASSPISQKLFDKFGFDVVKEQKFHEFTWNGEILVQGTGPDDTIQLRVKCLK